MSFQGIFEKRIGTDLVLINYLAQTVCILDEGGEEVWRYLLKVGDIAKMRASIEVPQDWQEDFQKFCDELDLFLHGKVRDPNSGMSLHQFFSELHAPLVVGLEINEDCQCRCLHCYNLMRSNLTHNTAAKKLPLSIVQSLAADLEKLGTPFVIITGGEPLLHPNFLEICQTICSKNIALKIFTNGMLLDKKTAAALKQLNVFLIGFTLFGHTIKSHEYITQTPNSFEQIIAGIKNAQLTELPVDVTFFLMKHNFNQREAMLKFAKDNFQLNPSFSFSLTPRENLDLKPFKLEISAKQMRCFFQENGIAKDSFQCGEASLIPCTAGKTLIAVKADGSVTPCVSLLRPVGNLNNQSFLEIWEKSSVIKQFRKADASSIKTCRDCKMNSFCLRCYVNAAMLGGDVWGKDPHACKVSAALQNVRKELTSKCHNT